MEIKIPNLNVEFESHSCAYEWYNSYAREVGFSVRKEYANKNKEGKIQTRRFVCSKEGVRRKTKEEAYVKKPRKETRTGCEARMTVSLQSTGKYKIMDFKANHNHDLVDSSLSYILPSHRKINHAQAIEVQLADDSGIRPRLAYELASRRVGGRANLGFLLVDHKNFLRTKRKNDLKYGEVGSLLNYFHNQLLENPSFFFKVQTDVEDQITNIFWADAKMVLDYSCFGDVLFFDTTYRTNKECRPFGAFIGLNHHYQQVVFGASLLYDETADSFKWLFETFFKCMSGQKPKTIFTDQDAAMAKAISSVMPETCHRLCLWHLSQNALKHLNQQFKSSKSFRDDFNRCVYDCEVEEEFFESWNYLIHTYELQENTWLQGLYEIREKWAMAYGREYFSAGKRSTQLSESFNSHIKDYLKSDLDLVQFFKHFQRAIDDTRHNEVLANVDMSQKIPRLKVNVPILSHAREVYTEQIFDMFQEEYEGSLCMDINSWVQRELKFEFKVCFMGSSRQHTVTFTLSDCSVHCSCKSFEFVGILCRHVLKVLDHLGMKMMIPERYILKRWSKNARVGCALDVNGRDIRENPNLELSTRHNLLCIAYVKLVGKAIVCKEAGDFLTRNVDEANAKVEEIMMTQSSKEPQGSSLPIWNENEDNASIVADLLSIGAGQAKGLKKRVPSDGRKRRYKSCLENGSKKKKGKPTQVTLASSLQFSGLANPSLNGNCESFQPMPVPSFTQMLMEPFDDTTYEDLGDLISPQHGQMEARFHK